MSRDYPDISDVILQLGRSACAAEETNERLPALIEAVQSLTAAVEKLVEVVRNK